MEKQDYIMRQIEMLSQVLKNIITKVLNMNIDISVEDYNIEINRALKSNLDIDINDLLEKDIVNLLRQTNNSILIKNNMELLAELLLALNDKNNNKDYKKNY